MSATRQPIRVGILGFGFMGSTHANAFLRAQRDGYLCELVAIADRSGRATNPGCNDVKVDLAGIECCTDPQQVLNNDRIDLVSICTHTDSHVDLAIQALHSGKHVLVEKPISLSIDSIEQLAEVATASDRKCMPAMCMRYWPAWVKIREMIQTQQYGPVHSADFTRLGSRPAWATGFYSDPSRSGGVLHDLHIHDTDFILSLFGSPKAVTTTGDDLRVGTLYQYDSVPHVYAQAGWDLHPSAGFRMECTIACKDATIDFDVNRTHSLVVHEGDETIAIDIGTLDGYDGQARALLDQVAGKPSAALTTVQDALETARILAAESLSRATGQPTSI